jgi:hypothetical protein
MNFSKKEKCFCGKKKYPIFNYSGSVAKYCDSCKKDGMIDVKNRMCKVCGIRANFKNINSYYCKNHKTDDCYNIHVKLCVVCKKTQANFNYLDEKPRYCFPCKEPDMVNIKRMNRKRKFSNI